LCWPGYDESQILSVIASIRRSIKNSGAIITRLCLFFDLDLKRERLLYAPAGVGAGTYATILRFERPIVRQLYSE
jgi:hypothetical protein